MCGVGVDMHVTGMLLASFLVCNCNYMLDFTEVASLVEAGCECVHHQGADGGGHGNEPRKWEIAPRVLSDAGGGQVLEGIRQYVDEPSA